MGCATSIEAAPPSQTHKLVDNYIKYLRLQLVDSKSTSAFLYTQAETIINSSHTSKQIEPFNSPGCILEITVDNKKTWGTCTLISPILILTSAMNVYNFKDKCQFNLTVKFYNKKKTSAEVARVFIPQAYMKGNLFQDYALLALHDPVWQFGFFGIKIMESPVNIESFFVNMFAFPIPLKADLTKYEKVMKRWRGLLDSIDQKNGVAQHSLTADSGVSGAGLCVINDHMPYIVGVQSRRDQVVAAQSYAILLTQKRFKQIRQWNKQLMTPQFERNTLLKLDFNAIQISNDYY